mmetsp:Transcript_51864/g.155651  ORF Transcript_51864/g.155651 Transcript_51864/m.155651 type:complete len:115 (+) Transcript_51864:1115-1459(+)
MVTRGKREMISRSDGSNSPRAFVSMRHVWRETGTVSHECVGPRHVEHLSADAGADGGEGKAPEVEMSPTAAAAVCPEIMARRAAIAAEDKKGALRVCISADVLMGKAYQYGDDG